MELLGKKFIPHKKGRSILVFVLSLGAFLTLRGYGALSKYGEGIISLGTLCFIIVGGLLFWGFVYWPDSREDEKVETLPQFICLVVRDVSIITLTVALLMLISFAISAQLWP